ncbi:MAG: MBL fold metallo-hydrolase [archaeon]
MHALALSSGSSGNCFYIEDKGNAILIDAGISAKKTVQTLSSFGKNAADIKGIFLTHEHTDHIRGVEVLSKKLKIPVFATKKTFQNSSFEGNEELLNCIRNNEVTDIGSLSVEAFSKFHKSADPVSYTVSAADKRVSVITDLGTRCSNTISHVKDADFLFLESNYDEDMLSDGKYPAFLKQWISSNKGHLSNMQASLLVLEHASPKLKSLVLSHLSKNNNNPELALNTMHTLIKERHDLKPQISVSLRDVPTALFCI